MENGARRMRVWLIAIFILPGLLFLADAVLGFATISASIDHFKTGSKNILAGGSIVMPYSVDDFHNDLEIEIPAILVSLIVLAAGPVGEWVLRKRKPRVAFVASLLALVSLVATFLLALLLVFSYGLGPLCLSTLWGRYPAGCTSPQFCTW
jgi:multisubunit Na+/H+ antiporter MnhB subunit